MSSSVFPRTPSNNPSQSRDRQLYNFVSRTRSSSSPSSGTLYRPPSRLIMDRPARQTVQINFPDHASTERDLEDAAGARQRSGDHPAEPSTDADFFNEVVMAVDIRDRSTVGCSYYVASEEKLYFMEDMKIGGPDVIEACTVSTSCCKARTDMKTVKLYIEPTVLLVSTRMDDTIIDLLDPDTRRRNESVDETSITACTIR